MTLKTSIQLTLTALVAVAVAAPAFGAGEPKNQPPFARQATAHSSAPRAISGMTAIVALGEAKNEAPFTARYNADPGYSSALREAAALMPVRTLQFFVLGDGAAPGQPGRSVTGLKAVGPNQAPNHYQVVRNAI